MKSWTMIPFKHKALFALVVSGILVSTCATRDTNAPADATVDASCETACPLPEPKKVEETVVAQENWSFKLPGNNWVSKEFPAQEIKAAMVNDSQEMIVLFVKEDTDMTYQQYAVASIRGFVENEARINSIKQVTINDRKFVLLQVDKDGEVIWAWITVSDGHGYVLTCGGDINVDAGTAQHDLCQTAADSLQIK